MSYWWRAGLGLLYFAGVLPLASWIAVLGQLLWPLVAQRGVVLALVGRVPLGVADPISGTGIDLVGVLAL